MRERFRFKHPLCEGPDSWCERIGRVREMEELDHIKRRADAGDMWDEKNLQGLCHECHAIKTTRENGGTYKPKRRIGIDGMPIELDS